MMNVRDDIHYVGVNDRNKTLFEGLWPLPYGISYNSYLIEDEKIVLIDTVDVNFFEVFLGKIKRVIGDKPIDYLVVNHMEPDHSGALNLLRKYYPDITIIGNKQTLTMLDGYYGDDYNKKQIADGESISIGQRNLHFYLIPMVHWPETMVTFDDKEKIVFSGDAFGCYGALNGGVIDSAINTDIYWDEMVRYYSNIVGKYGSPVQKALQKLSNLDITAICTTHGPVWTGDNIAKVTEICDKLSRYAATEGVVIAFGTMYGHTEQMAEVIAEELSAQGLRDIIIYNVSDTNHSYILADIFRYKGLILGCPTYNGQLYPQMEALLSKIAGRDMKDRYLGYFGSFTWAGAAVKKIGEFNEKLKFEVVGEPVEMKHAMKEDVRKKCIALAQDMAGKLKADKKN